MDDLASDPRIQVIHNTVNQGPLANAWNGFKRLGVENYPDAVLTVIDGDDRLAHNRALEVIRTTYEQHPDCLLTYGNYIQVPGDLRSNCEPFPSEVVQQRNFRKYKYVSSHLRTFRSVLWNHLDVKDLKDPRTGHFLVAAGDVAFMIPMLEMAGDRFRFIPEILYVYNRGNPLNEEKARVEERAWAERHVRGLPKYPLYRGQRRYRQTKRIRHALVRNPLVWRLLVMRHEFLERIWKGKKIRPRTSPIEYE